MTHLIKMKNSYLQKRFPKSTYEQLSSFFGFSSDEELLCGIWVSPIFRHGFIITNKALYWYFKTSDGIKTGEIQKESASNITFEISPQISSENSVASLANSVSEECSKLEIRAGGRTENFYITGLTEQKGKTLCDILKFAFTQNALPQIDLGELVKEMPLIPLRSVSDKFLNLGDKLVEEISDFKDYLIKGFHEITHIKFVRKQGSENSKSSKATESKQEKAEASKTFETNTDFNKNKKPAETEKKQPSIKPHETGHPILINILDVFATLLFIAGIVVIWKPELVTAHDFSEKQIHLLGAIAIAIYTLLKSIVAFYSKKVYKKVLPIILILVSILAYIMFTYSFYMYQNANTPKIYIPFIAASLIFALLSYFAFEYSCGYKSRTLFKKSVAIVILGFIIYVCAQYAIYPRKDELGKAASNFWSEISKFCQKW